MIWTKGIWWNVSFISYPLTMMMEVMVAMEWIERKESQSGHLHCRFSLLIFFLNKNIFRIVIRYAQWQQNEKVQRKWQKNGSIETGTLLAPSIFKYLPYWVILLKFSLIAWQLTVDKKERNEKMKEGRSKKGTWIILEDSIIFRWEVEGDDPTLLLMNRPWICNRMAYKLLYALLWIKFMER